MLLSTRQARYIFAGARGIHMKKEYAKPALVRREKLAKVAAVTVAPLGSLPVR